jgi:hypothetical protein
MRPPGRIDAAETGYTSAADLEAPHREHEERAGRSNLFHRSA